MSIDLHPDVLRAINRARGSALGRRFDRFARTRYGVSGGRLAAKQVAGESGGNMAAVSSAGARGTGQFIPSTRQEMIRRFGIDPWRSQDEAVQALMRYDLERGVAGYNAGMPSYTKYVLGQKLSPGTYKAVTRGSAGSGTPGFRGSGFGPGGTLSLAGPTSHDVTLGSQTIPGVSHAAERRALAEQLFLGGGPLNMQKLLAYKQQIGSLKDVPAQTVSGDIRVRASQGPSVRVGTRGDRLAGGAAGVTGRLGRVSISPTADRPGVSTNPAVVRMIRRIAGLDGRPLTIGTGSNHNQMTVDGNVSDHWSGNAADVPLAGAALIRAGRAALVAAGMPERQARRQNGGLYNVGGWQIIFNTHIGGDHTNHLHVGRRRR